MKEKHCKKCIYFINQKCIFGLQNDICFPENENKRNKGDKMKGFIEVTIIDDENKKSQKIFINVCNIVRVSSAENTYYKSLIDMVTNMGYYAVETYEEIKQKIKEAQGE